MRQFSISCNKLLVLLCFLSCFSTIVFGQDNDENLSNSPYGSATDLKGKTVVINCFVSKAGLEWTAEEKAITLLKESNGLAWLKKQAYNWKAGELSFDVVNLGLEKDITVDNIVHAFETKKIRKLGVHWATFSLHAAGIRNVYQFYDTLKTAHNADNVVVLVFANENGRSYAQPTIESFVKKSKSFFLEGAVVYKTGQNNQAMFSGTIIHEMLHLFGAWDMYHSETRSDDIERRIKGAFQHSIMLNDHDNNINQFNIDQLTGWCIGWTKTYWPWYEMFRNSDEDQIWNKIPGMVEKE